MMTAGLDLGDNYGYLSAWWMAKAVRSSRWTPTCPLWS